MPGESTAQQDLDRVLARVHQVWEPPVAAIWMESANGFLDGARPIDVLRTRGPEAVLDALDAAASGAFA